MLNLKSIKHESSQTCPIYINFLCLCLFHPLLKGGICIPPLDDVAYVYVCWPMWSHLHVCIYVG